MSPVADAKINGRRPMDGSEPLAARNLFAVDGVIAVVFAAGFLFGAPQLLAIYGIGVTAGTVLLARVLACFVLASGITQLSALRHADSPVAAHVTAGYLVCDVIATGVCSAAVAGGAVNSLGIGLVALFALLACWRAFLVLGVYRRGRPAAA